MRASVGLPPVDAPQFIVENTEYTLRMLKKYDVRATFFINGRSVTPQPGLIRRIADDGHEIAVHSFPTASSATTTPGRRFAMTSSRFLM